MLPPTHRCAQLVASRFQLARLPSTLRGLKKGVAAVKKAPQPVQFEALARGPIQFPELLLPGKRAVVVGVDPDINGAIAILSWQNDALEGSTPNGNTDGIIDHTSLATDALKVDIYDMPVDIWELGKRSKRQPSATAILGLLRQHVGVQVQGDPDGSDNSMIVRAVLEHSSPQHICGKHAWYGMGFSFGVFTGVLASHGIGYQRVEASFWKRHLGLFKLGKEGSLALAKQLFPQTAGQLKRKKDHGRAEAVLIAAWGLGVRMKALGSQAGSLNDSGEEGVDDSSGDVCETDETTSSSNEVEAAVTVLTAPKRRRRTSKAAKSMAEVVSS